MKKVVSVSLGTKLRDKSQQATILGEEFQIDRIGCDGDLKLYAETFRKFDGVLAMYHDQGLIPFKLLSQDQGVNFTAGLPIVRTSPAHGTAYDIAGKDMASPESFRHALYMAIDILKNRKEYRDLIAKK